MLAAADCVGINPLRPSAPDCDPPVTQPVNTPATANAPKVKGPNLEIRIRKSLPFIWRSRFVYDRIR